LRDLTQGFGGFKEAHFFDISANPSNLDVGRVRKDKDLTDLSAGLQFMLYSIAIAASVRTIKRGLSATAAVLSLVSGMFSHFSDMQQIDAFDLSAEAARKLTDLSTQFTVWAHTPS
jgi:hypothetical protein